MTQPKNPQLLEEYTKEKALSREKRLLTLADYYSQRKELLKSQSFVAEMPGEVLFDEDLPNGAKFLYSNIYFLNSLKGCFARNCYFCQVGGRKRRTIQRWLSLLRRKKLIEGMLIDKNTRFKWRILRPLKDYVGQIWYKVRVFITPKGIYFLIIGKFRKIFSALKRKFIYIFIRKNKNINIKGVIEKEKRMKKIKEIREQSFDEHKKLKNFKTLNEFYHQEGFKKEKPQGKYSKILAEIQEKRKILKKVCPTFKTLDEFYAS